MKKTISLKKAREILDSRTLGALSDEERQEIIQAYQHAPLSKSKPVVWQKYVLNGKTMIHTYCHACKKHGIMDSQRMCPHCGNEQRMPFSNYVDTKKWFVYILETNEDEGYFVFMMMPEYVEFQNSDQLNQDVSLSFRCMETPEEHSIFLKPGPYEKYIQMGMFLKNRGFLFKNCLSKNSATYTMQKRDFICSTVLNEALLRSFTEGMELKEFCVKFETKQTPKDAEDQSAAELAALPLPSHIYTDFPENEKYALCAIKTAVGDYGERYQYCSVCKKITLEKGNLNSSRTWICPECKEQFYSRGAEEYYKTQAIAEIIPNSSNLILRDYLIKYSLDANGTLTNNCVETCRVLISPKKITAIDFNKRKKIKISELGQWQYPIHTFQTLEQMQEIIADSALSHSGLIEWSVSPKRMMEYLDNVETYQCCPQREAFNMWYDYLDLASKINYDLTQRSVKFPNSLKKAHDIASYAFKAVAEEVHEKEFAARAVENDRYAFAGDDYIIKSPHSQQELIRESQILNHCVKVYIDRVREGKTVIAFLRNADEPDTPLYTMEIRNGTIEQLRGYCNRVPDDMKTLQFVQKYTKAKSLKQKVF